MGRRLPEVVRKFGQPHNVKIAADRDSGVIGSEVGHSRCPLVSYRG